MTTGLIHHRPPLALKIHGSITGLVVRNIQFRR